MSDSSHRPKVISDQLGISPATLRLWSNHFSTVLSPGAQSATSEKGTSVQRRYSATDVRYFHRAKQLLGQGNTYEEVLALLIEEGVPDPEIITERDASQSEEPTNALAIPGEAHMAIFALREALSSKDETIDALRDTVSANTRHVDDLRAENERLRRELDNLSESTKLPISPVSWWERLLGRGRDHGGTI